VPNRDLHYNRTINYNETHELFNPYLHFQYRQGVIIIVKVRVKLSLFLTKHYSKRTSWGGCVDPYFVHPDSSWWVIGELHAPAVLPPAHIGFGYSVDPRAGLDDMKK
jgi:hypothetical protein